MANDIFQVLLRNIDCVNSDDQSQSFVQNDQSQSFVQND